MFVPVIFRMSIIPFSYNEKKSFLLRRKSIGHINDLKMDKQNLKLLGIPVGGTIILHRMGSLVLCLWSIITFVFSILERNESTEAFQNHHIACRMDSVGMVMHILRRYSRSWMLLRHRSFNFTKKIQEQTESFRKHAVEGKEQRIENA